MKYNLTIYECSLFKSVYYVINTETKIGIHSVDIVDPALSIDKNIDFICDYILYFVDSEDTLLAQYTELTYNEVCNTIKLFRGSNEI